jgi:hypothetical protein
MTLLLLSRWGFLGVWTALVATYVWVLFRTRHD